MGKDKKHFDESLQETRSHNASKLRFLKRKQEDDEARERLEEYLKHSFRKDEDEDR